MSFYSKLQQRFLKFLILPIAFLSAWSNVYATTYYKANISSDGGPFKSVQNLTNWFELLTAFGSLVEERPGIRVVDVNPTTGIIFVFQDGGDYSQKFNELKRQMPSFKFGSFEGEVGGAYYRTPRYGYGLSVQEIFHTVVRLDFEPTPDKILKGRQNMRASNGDNFTAVARVFTRLIELEGVVPILSKPEEGGLVLRADVRDSRSRQFLTDLLVESHRSKAVVRGFRILSHEDLKRLRLLPVTPDYKIEDQRDSNSGVFVGVTFEGKVAASDELLQIGKGERRFIEGIERLVEDSGVAIVGFINSPGGRKKNASREYIVRFDIDMRRHGLHALLNLLGAKSNRNDGRDGISRLRILKREELYPMNRGFSPSEPNLAMTVPLRGFWKVRPGPLSVGDLLRAFPFLRNRTKYNPPGYERLVTLNKGQAVFDLGSLGPSAPARLATKFVLKDLEWQLRAGAVLSSIRSSVCFSSLRAFTNRS